MEEEDELTQWNRRLTKIDNVMQLEALYIS
jgi:hypothetical protein